VPTTNPPPTSNGGLIVPVGLGVARSKLREIINRFTTQEQVLADLANAGIHNPKQPEFQLPEVTVDALTGDSRSYTELFAKQLAWFNYLTQAYAVAKIALLEATNIVTLVENMIRDSLVEENKLLPKEQKMSAKELEAKILTHPDYIEALHELQIMTQYKIRLEAQVEVADRNMKVISREVEIKKIESEGAAREHNIGNMRRPITRY
jgi:hypothetical protein